MEKKALFSTHTVYSKGFLKKVNRASGRRKKRSGYD